MANKNSFVFYTEWLDTIKRLAERGTAEDVMALCDGIKAYVEAGEEIELPLAVEMAFCSIKNQIGRDTAKYEETSQRRKEARAKANKSEQTLTNADKPQQTLTNATVYEDEYGDEYVDDNDNDDVSPNGDNTYSSIDTALAIPEPQFVPEIDPNKLTDRMLEDEFNALWLLYPRKSGKKDALRHYKAARKSGVAYDTIEDGIRRYVRHIEAEHTDEQYIAMGSTWFCGHRWEDTYARPSPKPGSIEWLAEIARGERQV